MWQTFLLWRYITTPLPDLHPFRRLPALKIIRKKRSVYRANKTMQGGIILLFILLSALGSAIFVWICFLAILMIFGGFLFLFASGGYLAVKITNIIGKVQTSGLYDLISITPQGSQNATWSIGRIILTNTKWVRDFHIISRNTLLLIMGLSMLIEITDFIFYPIGIYFCSVQGLVMGYLFGVWSANLSTDGMNKVILAVGGFFGGQMMLYLSTLILFGLLAYVYQVMGWATFFTMPILELGIFSVLYEAQVRIMLRVMAHQAELPYSVWRSEVGI